MYEDLEKDCENCIVNEKTAHREKYWISYDTLGDKARLLIHFNDFTNVKDLNFLEKFNAVNYLRLENMGLEILHKLPPNVRKLVLVGCQIKLPIKISLLPIYLNCVSCVSSYINIEAELDFELRTFKFHGIPDCENELKTLPWSLEKLVCRNVKLLDTIKFPKDLKYMNLEASELPVSCELPESLETLICKTTQAQNLQKLPSNLLVFDFSRCNIRDLPELPDSLKSLTCREAAISKLPQLPENLESLDCSYCNLESLPELPISLKVIDCTHNDIECLPKLPENLLGLYCGENKLKILPDLPTNLITLDCHDNVIENLPELPDSMEDLHCGNFLTSLPKLPSNLLYLRCSGNFEYVPQLPERLQMFTCGSDIKLVPKLPKTINLVIINSCYLPNFRVREYLLLQKAQVVYETAILSKFVKACKKIAIKKIIAKKLEVNETIKCGQFLNGILGIYRQDPEFEKRWKSLS